MLGFKFSTLGAILIASMALIGCVPQAKQTECGSNEAFSPTQRKCLPITPSETSFIKIKSAVPTAGLTQTALSGAMITFSFMVDNPYNKPYRVRWLRNFNGAQSTLRQPSQPSANIIDHPYSVSLRPNPDLFSAVGNHVITAQILEPNSNSVVDSHDFALELTNEPTPTGQGFNPTLTTPIVFHPTSGQTSFSFSVLRNNRSMDTPIVRWTLRKLGTANTKVMQTDSLANTNNPQSVSFVLDPSNPFDDGTIPTAPFSNIVGSYRLEATIQDGSYTFSTYVWDFNIQHPDLGVITDVRYPIPGSSTGTIRAFNGIPYSNTTPSNFSYNNGTRAQFCVTVSTPTGQYGTGVTVKYYLGESLEPIYEALTTSSDSTICLDDPENLGKGSIAFTSANPELSWSTSIRARVFDSLTNIEYTTFTNGTYPIIWPVQVEPQNKAPVLTFTNNALDCPGGIDGTGTVRSGCKVTQVSLNPTITVDNSFEVTFKVKDEHFTGATLVSNISTSAKLFKGPTHFQDGTCTATTVATEVTYTCSFSVPPAVDGAPVSSVSSSPSNQWKILLTVADTGSPYAPTDSKTSYLTWNLDVTEINTPASATLKVSLNQFPYDDVGAHIGPATKVKETDTIVFNLEGYTDYEADSYTIEVAKCESTASCNSPGSPLYTSATINHNDPDWTINRRAVFTIPDGFIGDIVGTETVRFKVTIKDRAETATAVNFTGADPTWTAVSAPVNEVPYYVNLRIENHNPSPVFANLSALGQYSVFGTVPLKLDPGLVSDASTFTNANEAKITYQWWISDSTSGPWTDVQGATSRILNWTPGKEITSGTYYLKLCVTDGSPLRGNYHLPANGNPPAPQTPLCNNPAEVKAENHMSISDAVKAVEQEEMWGSPAIWIDDTSTTTDADLPIYAAFAIRDHSVTLKDTKIRVVKYFLNSDEAKLEKLGEVTFTALDPLVSGQPTRTEDVQDISIVGDSHSLYIAYMANYYQTAQFDEGGRPEIRRIRKDFNTIGSRTNTAHPAPFGFNYNGYYVDSNCTTCLPALPPDDQVLGGMVEFDFSTIATYPVTLSLSYTADPSDYVTFESTPTINSPLAHATDLVDQINSSDNLKIQGFSARIDVDGTKIIIQGPLNDDRLRIDQIATRVGKININKDTGEVILPFINASIVAPNSTSISLIKFMSVADDPLSTIVPSQFNMLGTQSSDLDNTIDDTGRLLVAYVATAEEGKGKLAILNAGDFDSGFSDQLIINTSINKIRISANNTDNLHYFAMGRSGTNSLHVGRFELQPGFAGIQPNTLVNWNMTSTDGVATTDNTLLTVSSFTNIWDFSINAAFGDSTSAVSHEARILLASDQGIFAFNALANDTVTCGDCLPLGKNGIQQPGNVTDPPLVVTHNKRLGVSQIVPNVLIGSAGNAGGSENKASMMSFAYIGEDIDPNPVEQRLYMGVINTNRAFVNSTTDHVDGHYGPVIFKK